MTKRLRSLRTYAIIVMVMGACWLLGGVTNRSAFAALLLMLVWVLIEIEMSQRDHQVKLYARAQALRWSKDAHNQSVRFTRDFHDNVHQTGPDWGKS